MNAHLMAFKISLLEDDVCIETSDPPPDSLWESQPFTRCPFCISCSPAAKGNLNGNISLPHVDDWFTPKSQNLIISL